MDLVVPAGVIFLSDVCLPKILVICYAVEDDDRVKRFDLEWGSISIMYSEWGSIIKFVYNWLCFYAKRFELYVFGSEFTI